MNTTKLDPGRSWTKWRSNKPEADFPEWGGLYNELLNPFSAAQFLKVKTIHWIYSTLSQCRQSCHSSNGNLCKFQDKLILSNLGGGKKARQRWKDQKANTRTISCQMMQVQLFLVSQPAALRINITWWGEDLSAQVSINIDRKLLIITL